MPDLGLIHVPLSVRDLNASISFYEFHLPTGPGLGLQINEAQLAKRPVSIAYRLCPRQQKRQT